jgi:hypothetical protein
MSSLLLEGGLYGHLNHLYDNPDLSFGEIKKIFDTASSGELQGTEKTDGQNLFISYSVKDGKAKAARNKGNIKTGGMDAMQLASKFADRGALEKAFVDSFDAFEKVIRQLSPEEQREIFGEDANIFYNAEIMDPANPNVINYDTRSLVIHQKGHSEFDRETGNIKDTDVSSNVDILQNALEGVQQSEAAEDFTVQMNAIKNLQNLGNDAALKKADQRINKIISSVGLSDRNTIGEFINARLSPVIDKKFPMLDDTRKDMLIRRLSGEKGIKVTTITKGLDREAKAEISSFVKSGKKIMGEVIGPLEKTIHDFSVEMLRGLESAFILDNDAEVKRLAGEVGIAIDAINGSNRDDVMDVVRKHLEKIGKAENISTATEGFVFDWDGVTYKFTGNFAPANQILGIFKYGRGKIPALQKEVMLEQESGKTIGIHPGGFKPPHAGHFFGAKHLLDSGADEVIVIISPKSREGYSSDKENTVEITADQSLKLWELYIKSNNLGNKMSVMISDKNSPVASVYDYLENLSNGDTVFLGKGEKDQTDTRFDRAQSFADKRDLGLSVEMINTPMFGGGISGTQMREIIANNDFKSFAKYIPLRNLKDKKKAWSIMTKKIKEHYVNRNTFMKETILREAIRKIIAKADKKAKVEEDVLRGVIQKLILENEADRVPHASTAINFLEDLLKSILPGIEQDYKSLTTKQAQRDAFRSQLVSSVNSSLETAKINNQAAEMQSGNAPEEGFIDIEEEIEIDITDDDKFIDIDPEETPEEEIDAEVKQDATANETGSKLAAQSFDSIEKQTLEAYNTLSDEEDQKTFQDYLITNLKLYFDKWEKELGEVIEPTTDEYEEEKVDSDEEEIDAEASEEEDLGTEEEGDEEELDFDL